MTDPCNNLKFVRNIKGLQQFMEFDVSWDARSLILVSKHDANVGSAAD